MVLRESMRCPSIYRGKWARTLVASYVEMLAGRVLVIRRVWSGRVPPDTWEPADRSLSVNLNRPTHLWSVLNYECCSDNTSRRTLPRFIEIAAINPPLLIYKTMGGGGSCYSARSLLKISSVKCSFFSLIRKRQSKLFAWETLGKLKGLILIKSKEGSE